MPVPLPPDEEARLKELANYGLLDTPPEPAFDRITRLAAQIFRVPSALISLIDRERQWFKARYGPGAVLDTRESAFCAYAILEPRTLIVPDATADARFRTNPTVTRPDGVRFYVGAPLTTPKGFRLGTLCLLDQQPREFPPADVGILEDLAALVMDEMNLRLNSQRSLWELERRKRADLTMRSTRDELEVRIQQRTTALVEAEARYRGIFEHAVEGIYQARPGGGFLNVNPAFARLLGYPSPEALIEAVPDPAQLYVRAADHADFGRRLAAEGVVANLEREVYRADGARVWLCENAHAVCDADGAMLRYEGTVTDVTSRRAAEEALQRAHEELEDRVRERTTELGLLNGDLRQEIAERQHAEEAARRSENKFRTLLENAQDLISIFSPEGVLLYASPSLQNILGYQPDELIGSNLFEGHLHPADCADARQRLARPLQADGSYVRSEVRMRHRDGTWRTLESISSPLPPDFPVVGLVVNSRDITERLRNEREVEARARQQAAVAELGRQALRRVDLPALFDRAAQLVTEVLGVNRTGIGELLPGGERLLIRAGTGFPAGVVGQATVKNWHLCTSHEDRPLLVPDMRKVLDYSALPRVEAAAISAASAAIHDGPRPYGTLAVLSTVPREFTPEEQVFLQTVADLLSTVIESRRHQTASEEVEARYQRIAANTPGMVYQAIRRPDGTGAVPFVSEGCRQICGLEPAQVQAQPELLNNCIHPEDRPRFQALLAVSNAALSPFQWEGRVVLPDGQVRWITVRSRPELMPNGDIFRDGVVIDVTELKHAQEAMRAAKEEAERANNAKSEFLSRMSHELRTPLNAILGFGQLLELDELTPLQNSSVEQILTGGRHLLDLVNEVLDIARIEAGGVELTLEKVDVNAAVAATLRFVQPMAAQNQVRLVHRCASCAVCVRADPGRFSQVLLNLLSNAIKYNHAGGEVRVSCRRQGGDRVRIIVADTGPGLGAAEVSRLFTPFQRLKAPERGITGTGIGLVISKGLVEVMGGSIGVRSTPGKGSRFYVDLPLLSGEPEPPIPANVAPVEPLPAATAPPPPAVKTVLHIDDQPTNLSLVERLFETRADLRLLAEMDGRSGLARARAERPDLILLDLHLPDISGDEVVRRLHTERRTSGIPVLVLSADATPGQIERLRGLGVRDYVTKPFKIDALLQAIDAALLPAK